MYIYIYIYVLCVCIYIYIYMRISVYTWQSGVEEIQGLRADLPNNVMELELLKKTHLGLLPPPQAHLSHHQNRSHLGPSLLRYAPSAKCTKSSPGLPFVFLVIFRVWTFWNLINFQKRGGEGTLSFPLPYTHFHRPLRGIRKGRSNHENPWGVTSSSQPNAT